MKVKRNSVWSCVAALLFASVLAACGSVPGSSGSSSQSASAVMAPAPPAVPFAQAKFSFAPVTGAPASLLNNLSAQLGREAFAQHVNLVPAGDPTANYVVKGYLSAVGDTSGTILVYVWDVFDTSGRRVHRISGQETSATGSQDPWGGVNSDTTNMVARRTIGALISWGNSSAGTS